MGAFTVEQFEAASKAIEKWPAEIDTLKMWADCDDADRVQSIVKRLRESFAENAWLAETSGEITLVSSGPIVAAGSTYSSAHLAAIDIAKRLYFIIWQNADYSGFRSALAGGDGQFDDMGIKKYWTAVRHAILSFPSFDWSALKAGIQRERALFVAHLSFRKVPIDKELAVLRESQDRNAIIEAMPKAVRIAYVTYQNACEKSGKQLTDADAHAWLKENVSDPDSYVLPSVDTFAKYLRTARSKLGEQKNQPRAGRKGHSVVSVEQI
jgi:hypothetical protein